MKSRLFLAVLLLATITTFGISQEKQTIKPPPGFGPPPVKPGKTTIFGDAIEDFDPDAYLAEKERFTELNRIGTLPEDTRSLVGVKGVYILIGLFKIICG